MGRKKLGYLGEFRSWAPLTWTLKTHFIEGPANPGECSKENSDSELPSESDLESEDDLLDI